MEAWRPVIVTINYKSCYTFNRLMHYIIISTLIIITYILFNDFLFFYRVWYWDLPMLAFAYHLLVKPQNWKVSSMKSWMRQLEDFSNLWDPKLLTKLKTPFTLLNQDHLQRVTLSRCILLTVGYLDIYLVQLIEHPILRIPNILFVYFLSIFPDKGFKLISKYTQKCQYNSLY